MRVSKTCLKLGEKLHYHWLNIYLNFSEYPHNFNYKNIFIDVYSALKTVTGLPLGKYFITSSLHHFIIQVHTYKTYEKLAALDKLLWKKNVDKLHHRTQKNNCLKCYWFMRQIFIYSSLFQLQWSQWNYIYTYWSLTPHS